MRSVLGFVSLLTIGLFTATALSLVGAGSGLNTTAGGLLIHYPSLTIGLVTGFLVASLGQIAWGEIPRRIAHWLFANQWNLTYAAAAVVLAGVLVLY